LPLLHKVCLSVVSSPSAWLSFISKSKHS
jgi:hypothetical protein